MAIDLDSLPMSRLETFCRRWGVTELALFGSALRDDFGPRSGVDVLVSIARDRFVTYDDWLAMEAELRALFGRDVDLVDRGVVEKGPNYISRRHILSSARRLYAA